MNPCKYCNADLAESLDFKWANMSPDYEEYFEFQCPKCGMVLNVEVQPTPVFILSKLEEAE